MNSNHYDHEKLAEMRRKIGKQDKVAEKLGITVTQLSRAENGKSASYELLCAITKMADKNILDVLKSNQSSMSVT